MEIETSSLTRMTTFFRQALAQRAHALRAVVLTLCFLIPVSVLAADACTEEGYEELLAGLESSGGCATGSPGYTCTNTLGYLGKYQFGWKTLTGLGYTGTKEQFLNDPAAQEKYHNMLYAQNKKLINTSLTYKGVKYPPLSSFIGKKFNGVTITAQGLQAACHNLGCAGLSQCLGGGKCTDGYGTNVAKYLSTLQCCQTLPDGSEDCSSTYDPGVDAAEICDQKIYADVTAQVEGTLAKREDFVSANFTPPPSVNQVANTPCKSKELQRISNQFANAPSQYLTGITSGLLSAGGPVSGIMQKLFAADFESINKAASFLPQMLNFQSQASSILSNLLGSLGLGDAFSSEVCGLMVDMLLKYVQCQNPIELPQLGNMFGSLNDLLPDGCAGEVLREGLMEAGNMQSLKTTNQPILFNGGRFVPGDADWLNKSRGLE